MWINREKLEALIDERAEVMVKAVLDVKNYDAYRIIKKQPMSMFPNLLYKDVQQNQLIDLILNHLGIELTITPQIPQEVKLVKTPKAKKG